MFNKKNLAMHCPIYNTIMIKYLTTAKCLWILSKKTVHLLPSLLRDNLNGFYSAKVHEKNSTSLKSSHLFPMVTINNNFFMKAFNISSVFNFRTCKVLHNAFADYLELNLWFCFSIVATWLLDAIKNFNIFHWKKK